MLLAGVAAAAGLLHLVGLPGLVRWPATLAALAAAMLLLPETPPEVATGLAGVVIAACGALTLAEGLLRGRLGERLRYRPHDRFVRRWTCDPDLYRYRRSAAYAGTEYGDLAALSGRPELRQVRATRFETDARGFRNAPDTAPGQDGEPLDVILLSDSFGVGVGTTQEEAWPARLRARGHRVYSLSIPGSPWRALLNLKAELDTLPVHERTRVVWTIFLQNDLDGRYRARLASLGYTGLRRIAAAFSIWRRRSGLQLALDRARAATPSSVVERTLPDGRSLLFYRPYAQRGERSAHDVRSHANWKRLAEVMREMRRFCDERELDVVVLTLSSKSVVYGWLVDGTDPDAAGSSYDPGPAEAVSDLCREVGLTCVDLTPDFVAEAARLWRERGELLWWTDDTHWNARGHELAARLVSERVL